ncbi:apolipoprotein N-acyltransferase [Aliarcobacter lanthieri]|uniref:apolipoprotein N-acyltransferase n=1 Tax=Aliarcobacter lanthieri TaxID=1355374 RepID=UPI00047DD36D|nr:apolipoprotein N-acyltransferase [Aliarcobacter lanthieri]
MFLLKTEYFNKIYIIKGFITAILLSTFIYLAHFGIEIKIINTILGLAGIYLLLTIPKKALFYAGFFTGIFWCYWMAISLQYYGIAYVAPLLILSIGLVFGIIFFLFAIIDKITFRIFMVFAFLFVSPFGFNWLKLELLFVDSYISTTKIAFALVLLSMYFVIKLKRAKALAILPILFTLNFGSGEFIDTTKAKIYMPQMDIQQNLKWQKESLDDLIKYNLHQIFEAIENKYDLVILPETAFPIALNRYPQIDTMLKELSNEIDIITGALYVENNKIFNASYHYSKEKVQIAQKVVLVPFGEKIPLPKFFVDLINKVFYNGAQDYSEADNPTDFEVLGEKYRNAICYEGTTDKIYENLDDTRYMIMISNNAWFAPSIEPTLQHLLLKYYSKKYGITIFHTANGSKNRIYRP